MKTKRKESILAIKEALQGKPFKLRELISQNAPVSITFIDADSPNIEKKSKDSILIDFRDAE